MAQAKVKKRSGDNFPLDIKGQMMYVGSIVVVPWMVTNEDKTEVRAELRLGYISKLTKSAGVDVTVFVAMTEKGKDVHVMRYRKPGEEINIIDDTHLKPRDPLHEAVRFAARMAANEF